MAHARNSERLARVIAEIAVASIGGALLVCALAANQRWLDRHFLPSWFLPRQWYVLIESSVRVVMAVVGVSLAIFARPRIGRFVARAPARAPSDRISGGALSWMPPAQGSRLASIAQRVVPFRGDEAIERGITMTREVLRATVDLARARGATPLILVPQFGPEEQAEQALRRRILDEAGLPYLLVEIDAAWRLPWDRHPNPRAAHAIAAAVAARLRGR